MSFFIAFSINNKYKNKVLTFMKTLHYVNTKIIRKGEGLYEKFERTK